MTTTRNVGHLETMASGLDHILYVYINAGCSRLKGKRPTEKPRELLHVAIVVKQ